MEGSFLAMITDGEVGKESFLATIVFAALPISKVFTMCFLGFLMATNYVNILSANGRKQLNRLVYVLLLPCLIFSQLGQAITFENLIEWWYIPVNIVLGTISGSIIGFIVACIIRPPKQYFKFTIIHIGIGNIGNIPLVLIAALCRDPSNPFGNPEQCNQQGNAYISYGQWVGAIILYTFVNRMLNPPPGGFDATEEKLPIRNQVINAAPEEVPLLTAVEPEEEGGEEELDFQTSCQKVSKVVCSLFDKIRPLLQPPIVASMFGILFGSVPFLKRLILTEDAPLFFFTDSCLILGQAMIPCILLALGGNLVDGPGPGIAKLGLRTTMGIVFGRLVLVPPAGLGIVFLAEKLGFSPPGNKMFTFVLLLQHSMPTSVLSATVSSLKGCGKEAAAVLFWVHIFAMLTMPVWITLYLNILF